MQNRRRFIAGSAALGALAVLPAAAQSVQDTEAIDIADRRAKYVKIGTGFDPYEIHVLPDEFGLYWILPDMQAIRYWIGVARDGLYESGVFSIEAKKEWPSWTPTPEMIEREPELYKQWEDGMPGGPGNPLGARALYLFTENGYDSFLRIHGTQDDHTIGQEVSNGCARLTNGYIIDLYNRVPLGTKVHLHPKRA